MSSRFWNFVNTLIGGQTARSEQVTAQLQEVDTAFGGVEAELNRSIRLMDGTPTEATYQLLQNAAARASKLLGFDSGGNLALIPTSFSWRGDWAASTPYNINDVIRGPLSHNYSLYICVSAHTSAADFATDLGSRWAVAIDLTEARRSLILHTLITGPNTVALSPGQDVMVDVTGGAVNLILPAAPVIGDQPINIMHVGGNLQNFPITVQRNGKFIMGVAEDMTVDSPNASFGLAFADDSRGWRIRGV